MSLRCSILTMILLLLVGCGTVDINSAVVDVDPADWSMSTDVVFNVADTVQRFDMELILRSSRSLERDSVELLMTTTAPDGVLWSEYFTLYPQHSAGAITVTQSPYRSPVRFSQMGDYKVTFQPQHRYKGVMAVGVSITPLDKDLE